MSHYRTLREEIRDRVRAAVPGCVVSYNNFPEPIDTVSRALIACDEDSVVRTTRGRSVFLDWKFKLYVMTAVPSDDVAGYQWDLIDTIVMQLDPFDENDVPAPPGAFAGLSNNYGVTAQRAHEWAVEDDFVMVELEFSVQTEVFV